MIQAEHKKWARLLYDFYITRLLKRNFNRFLLTNEFPSVDSNSALIITPNHFSWWDGFFIAYYSNKMTSRKIHLLMLEEQLRRYWFFSKIGAYSININNPKSTIESINYTANVLNDKNNFVVYYPQGKIEDYNKRPPSIKEGIIRVVDRIKLPTVILPVVFKISYSTNKLPDILVRAGKIFTINPGDNFFSRYKENFSETLSELDQYSLTGNERDLFIR